MSETVTDARLVEESRKGSREAFQRLVERYENRVFQLARRLTGNWQDAEDVLQQTFLDAYRALPKFRGDSQFSTWLYRIATNRALMKLRRREPERTVSLDDAAYGRDGGSLGYVTDWSTLPAASAANEELREQLEQAISGLPPEGRAVFELRDVEGLPIREVAGNLGISVPAAKSRLHRARLYLRGRLSQYFDVRKDKR